ncbi:hypothetical protein LTR28_005104 [Elasticomyces elasticus]|nr:hypothetical protein LTR28_005104 [Elasticomyces elasticus]
MVPLPPPLETPFSSLGKPLRGLMVHAWRSTKGDLEHWHAVKVQTIFSTGGFQRYFTVHCEGAEESGPAERRLRQIDEIDNAAILEDWEDARRQHEKELERIDAETAKTDNTLWYKRTG